WQKPADQDLIPAPPPGRRREKVRNSGKWITFRARNEERSKHVGVGPKLNIKTGPGRIVKIKCWMSIRRTTSLLISRPKALEICSAILRQPIRGLRLFISMTAAISSLERPLGPGRRVRWEPYRR